MAENLRIRGALVARFGDGLLLETDYIVAPGTFRFPINRRDALALRDWLVARYGASDSSAGNHGKKSEASAPTP